MAASPQPGARLEAPASSLQPPAPRFTEGDVAWDPIVSIEPLPPEPVFDIEVEGTHNFVANGIIAHNTYLKGATADTTAPALNAVNSAATSLLYVRNDGNVGIGTTSPGAGLDVQKAITASSGVARGVNIVQTLTTSATTDALTALRVTPTFTADAGFSGAGGAIGIDLTGPMIIRGYDSVGGTQAMLRLTGNRHYPASVANPYGIWLDATLQGAGGTSAVYGLRINPTVNKSNTSSASFYGAAIDAIAAGTGTDAITNAYGLYLAAQTIATNNWSLYVNSGTSYFGGNVGIGTTSPNDRLHVAGATTADATKAFVTIGTTAIAAGNATAGTGGTWVGINAPGTGAGSTADFLTFQANGTLRLNFTNAGRLGINISPATPLHVSTSGTGDVEVLRASSNADSYLTVGNTNAGNDGAFMSFNQTSNFLRLGVHGDAAPLGITVASGGNVGIGTVSPTQKLAVVGDMSVRKGDKLLLDSDDGTADTYLMRNTGATTVSWFVDGIEIATLKKQTEVR